MSTCSTVSGSSVGEYVSGRFRLSLSVKSLAMKAVAELLTFLVIGSSNGRVWLEYVWLHSEVLKPYCWSRIDQSAMATVELSGKDLNAYVMRRFVVSIVTGS